MAIANVFKISKDTARGYKVPRNRPILPNGAGVTAIMGLTNGLGAAERRRRAKRATKQCRDDSGRFQSCFERNSAEPNRRSSIRTKKGGATCWKKPRTKYTKIGATKRSDYAYPECWAYPIKGRGPWTKRLVPRAMKWFKVHGHKYSPSVRDKIAARIERAADALGLSTKGVRAGRGMRRARRNEGERPMIVMEAPDYMENRRGKRRGKKKATRRTKRGHKMARVVMLSASKRGIGVRMRRNADEETSSDSSSLTELIENRRRRGRKSKSSKRRGRKSYGRKSYSRSAARRTRRGRKSYGRKSRKSSRKAKSFKGIRKVSARHSGRGLTVMLRNTTITPNLTAKDPITQAYLRGLKSVPPQKRAAYKAKWSQRLRGAELQRRQLIAGHRATQFSGGGWGGFLPPWARAAAARRAQKKAENQARKARRMGLAYPAVFSGLTGRDLKAAMKDMTRKQVEKMFPDYATFRAWMGGMKGDKKFRRWSGKAKKSGRGRRRWGRGRGRWSMAARRRSRGRRRGGWGRRAKGRGRKAARRSRRGRGRGRKSSRRGRWSRKFRRNSMYANMPFASGKEMALAGLLGLATFGLINYGAKFAGKFSPLAGAGVGLALGAAAAFGSDKVFKNDAYAKGVAVAGIISLIVTAGKALMGMFQAKAAAGFGNIGSENTRAHYVLNPGGMGAFYQAQAGLGAPFMQAQAGMGAPFLQAQAGYGDYYSTPFQGTGEYVSTDGSVSPVSDFGEYVAQNLAVEGYGDYEVMPQYTPGADGFGYVNDGVNPAGDLGREFDIIEAAAGLGATAANPMVGRSDYIPTVMSGQVGGKESTDYSGVFDVGGSNGVFG